MARIWQNCDMSYNDALFQCIFSGSSDSAFNQCISFGCLYKVLRWARDKHQLLKSGISNTYVVENSADSGCVSGPNVSNISNLPDLVHGIIRHIDMYGASTSSSTSQKQLKHSYQLIGHWIAVSLGHYRPVILCWLKLNPTTMNQLVTVNN